MLALVVVRDISARKHATDKLKEANEALSRANQELHDSRTRLADQERMLSYLRYRRGRPGGSRLEHRGTPIVGGFERSANRIDEARSRRR